MDYTGLYVYSTAVSLSTNGLSDSIYLPNSYILYRQRHAVVQYIHHYASIRLPGLVGGGEWWAGGGGT